MVSMKRGQDLHDRATRNLPLADGERVELQEWYDQMNAAEAQTVRIPDSADLVTRQKDIDVTLRVISATASEILELREENRQMRDQIAQLQAEYLRKRAARA